MFVLVPFKMYVLWNYLHLWSLVCLGAFVLCVVVPGMGTDTWLLKVQIFPLSPWGLDPTHVLEAKLIITVNVHQTEGGEDKPGLFCLNEKGKKSIWDLCIMLVLSWNRGGYFSLLFLRVWCGWPLTVQRQYKVRVVHWSKIFPATPACWSVAPWTAK